MTKVIIDEVSAKLFVKILSLFKSQYINTGFLDFKSTNSWDELFLFQLSLSL